MRNINLFWQMETLVHVHTLAYLLVCVVYIFKRMCTGNLRGAGAVSLGRDSQSKAVNQHGDALLEGSTGLQLVLVGIRM